MTGSLVTLFSLTGPLFMSGLFKWLSVPRFINEVYIWVFNE